MSVNGKTVKTETRRATDGVFLLRCSGVVVGWEVLSKRRNHGAFQVVLEVKNLPARAGDVRDIGSLHGLEDPLEEGTPTHSSILAWIIPWTEEAGWLQSMGSQRGRYNLNDLAPSTKVLSLDDKQAECG